MRCEALTTKGERCKRPATGWVQFSALECQLCSEHATRAQTHLPMDVAPGVVEAYRSRDLKVVEEAEG